MTGESSWIDLLPLLVIAAGLLALSVRGTWHYLRTVRLRLACPDLKQEVDCTARRDSRTGLWVDVTECSATEAFRGGNCGQACVRSLNHSAARL